MHFHRRIKIKRKIRGSSWFGSRSRELMGVDYQRSAFKMAAQKEFSRRGNPLFATRRGLRH
jgi:hypothetical protein